MQADAASATDRREITEVLGAALTDAQKEMWLLAERDDNASRAYNIPLVLGLRGPLNSDALRHAIEDVAARHEALRTTISADGSEQRVASTLTLDVPLVDLSHLPASDRDEQLNGRLAEEVNGLFDLTHGPLCRVSLIRIEPTHHLLILVVHHILTDGWSMGVLAKGIAEAYAARLQGSVLEKQAPLQFRDYAGWLNEQLQQPSMKDHESYWLGHLSGPLPQLELVTDRPRPKGLTFSGARESLTMGAELVQRLYKLSQENNCTPFMTLLAGYMALLHRLSGQDDLIVLVPVASRALRGGGDLVGYCVNILPIRGRLSPGMTCQQYLTELRATLLDAYAHAAYPFVSLFNQLRRTGVASPSLLFGPSFNLNAPLTGALSMPDLDIDLVQPPIDHTLHELSLDIVPVKDELHLELGYNTDLFNADTAARFAQQLMRVFEHMADDPTRRVRQLDLLGEEQRHSLLVDWNATEVAYRRDLCLHELFEAQVEKTPQATALVFEDRSLSYAELDAQANQLARHLHTLGVGPDVPVGVCMERSLEMVVALYGILKAGGAYVPLDPEYPKDRLGHIMAGAELAVVLTQGGLEERLPPSAARVLALDEAWPTIAQAPVCPPMSRVTPENLAYVIYTSGSTGRPKGVAVSHGSIVNRLLWMQDEYGLEASDRVLQKTPFSFDVSVWEFFWPLLNGACLVVAQPGGHRDSAYLAELITREAITTLHFVPPMLGAFLEEPESAGCRTLRRVICSGEALPLELMQRHHARLGAPLHNLYGPTEAAVDVSYWACDPRTPLATVPIGRPVANTQLYILDPEFNPVPVGVAGELYIGGVQLARGYLNRPDLTAERFVPSPYADTLGARLYKTGDLARFLPDGNIEFLGRIDHQVKMRGFRIELGEIEAVLAQYPAVREAVVLAREDHPGDKRLAAYVVADAQAVDGRESASEWQTEQVESWKEVYEDTYVQGSAEADPTFNITGWNSSYTGQPIPSAEMREWVEETVAQIRELRPARVLEIGCGTGLLLLRLVPRCRDYVGLDLSKAALGQLEGALADTPYESRVTLLERQADDFEGLESGAFDTVILNSVSQHFPHIDYLLRVLTGAIERVKPGGAVFVGDVRSLPLLEAFHTSVELAKAEPCCTRAELRRRIHARLAAEDQLLVDPAFFVALKEALPRISHVEVRPKRGHSLNELTKFRYDVSLHIEADVDAVPEVAWLDWRKEAMSLSSLRERLQETQSACLGLRGVPNARLGPELWVSDWLASDSGPGTVGEVCELLKTQSLGVEPQALCALSEELPYSVELSLAPGRPDGSYDVLFSPRSDTGRKTPHGKFPTDPVTPKPWTAYANNPLSKKFAAQLIPKLQAWLQDELPEYMVPSAFVMLETLPLTPNGKVDRKALPVPEARVEPAQEYVAPRTPVEEFLAEIWAEVLGLERVGIHDDFFDLGGHSLLATQVASRVRGVFKIELPLRELFDAPTIEGLAGAIETVRRVGEGLDETPIMPVPRDTDLPLSFAQQRLWFLDRLEPDSPFYNIPAAVRLQGRLDRAALERGLNTLIARHEALRTSFRSVEGEAVQVIASALTLELPVRDLKDLPDAEREARAQALCTEEAQRSFDLAEGPLLRAQLLRLADDQHILQLTFHHIVSDGWSLGVFVEELATLYRAFAAAEPSPLAPLPIQYADFAHWQRQWLQGEVLERQLSYWKAQLEGLPALLELPTDRPRPAIQTFHGARHPITLPSELTQALHALSREAGASLFMTLLAAFQVLLARYSGQDDFAVGTPIANRNRTETEGLIGFFVNTLVLRADLADNPSIQGLLARIKETTLGAYAHQDLPFERLVDELHPQRDMSHAPLFQVMFALQNAPLHALELPGLRLTPWMPESGTAKFDLTLDLMEADEALSGTLEYNTDLFEAATVARLVEHYITLLEGIVQTPQARIAELPLVTAAEGQQLLVDWNATEVAYRRDLCLHELFEAQVEKTPQATALVFEDRSLSYAELDAQANQLARHLHTLGVGPDVPVGVCMERSLEMVVALYGILKAGGAYVPLDPEYPKDRLGHIMAGAELAVVLTQGGLEERLPPSDARVVALDEAWPTIAQAPACPPMSRVTPENLAYVIYTSGSTGRPKGVAVSHASIVNRLLWMQDEYGLEASDRVLQKTPFSFDVSVWEFFWPLLNGACLVVAKPGGHRDSAYLAELITRDAITTLHFVPPMLGAFLEEPGSAGCRTLRRVICSGEALPLELMQRHYARLGVPLHNLYGPTEAAVDVSYWACDPETALATVPIGRPVANTQLYILDPEFNPVPVGVAGELYIGGVQLARGYLSRPDLTAERFVPSPYGDTPGARLYKTGDLSRFLPDGNIEFLGRIDHQVKLRGFRIELGEIEAVLTQHSAVREAVVLAREHHPGDKRLAAYAVAAPDSDCDVGALRAALKGALPEYMVPAAFVVLEALPLTPNGKVDRKALPPPDLALAHDYVAPRTPTELTLADIWAEVLGIERVGIHDNFFELGGHSLLVTQVVSRIRAAFEVELPLRALFEAPTIAELAHAVEAARHVGDGLQAPPIMPVARDDAPPLSFAQQRLWFLDQLTPNDPFYNMPGVVRLQGALDVAALEGSLNALIVRHEALRTTFCTVDGEAVQVISAELNLTLPPVDLSKVSAEARETKAHALAAEEAQRPFDLATGPLLRAQLLRLAEDDHLLQVTFHHIVSDGWSLGVFIEELATLYRAQVSGQTMPLAPLPIQYADFAHWQRQWLQGEVLDQQRAYWREQFQGLPPLLELPTDRPRPPMQTFHGAHHSITISPALTQALRTLSREAGVTLFMTLLAAFQVLLARYTGQRDFAVGTPIANRNRAETEGLIGFFVNTLALRAKLSDNPSFQDLLARTKESTLGAYAHQDLPLERLVDELQPERDLSHAPLFQVMFALQNTPVHALELPDLKLTPWALESGTAKFDLSLELAEEGDAVTGSFEYNTDLFEATTIARLAGYLVTLLEGIANTPAVKIAELPLLPPAERQQLLVEWNATQIDYPSDQCIHQLFEAQVERAPEAIAVVFEEESLTYVELNSRANQLAHYLRSLGVGPDTLVGLCVERSAQMIIGLLGILKAGGAYVPFDWLYPQERLAFMLEDTQVPVLVTQDALVTELPLTNAKEVVCLDSDWSTVTTYGENNPVNQTLPEHLGYVIYTSGSAGRPKGVTCTHRNMSNSTGARIEYYGGVENLLFFTSLAFDSTSAGLLWTLATGGQVTIAPEAAITDFGLLDELMRTERPSHFIGVSSLYSAFIETGVAENLQCLKRVIVGGEALTSAIVARHKKWSPQASLHNEYGPTEATVWTTVRNCFSAAYNAGDPDVEVAGHTVSIGRPIANTQAYILDSDLNPVPGGVRGELYIGGVQLARGYLNRPDLTAERFIPNPFNNTPGERLYRTGDLARYLPDGNIELLGRIDHQVKVRGFRIELGEIEVALAQHPEVREAVVLARERSSDDKRLVAYVVAAPGARLDISALRAHLNEKLPEYMVPAAFVLLDVLPLTPNGKVDRKALPAPERLAALDHEHVAPRNPTEQKLADIWAELLRVERVGIHDNFFELGGDSILGIQIISRASQAELKLTARQLFENQTVAALAAVAGTAKEITAEQGLVTGPVPLSPIQQWFFERPLPVPQHFNQSVLLEVHEALEPSLLQSAIEHLLEHHDALRMRFETAAFGWQQAIAEHETHEVLTKVDLVSHRAAERLFVLESTAEQLQASLDISHGPLLRAALFHLGLGEPDRLLLIIHHLVVDGVSWRILIEDLFAAYKQLQADQSVALPPKTTSFKHWSEQLQTHAQSEQARGELEFWLKLAAEQPISSLPVDTPGGANTVGASRTVSVSLSPEETQALLQDAPEAYRTQVNDLLLTALAQTLSTWSGSSALWVDLEGHGREPFSDELDVSRTVGWFTSLFPCHLDLERIGETGSAIKTIKEQLRAVPRKGFGFGLLRYLGGPEVRAKLDNMPKPEVCFNYLGQFDQGVPNTPLQLARENRGAEHHADEPSLYLLDISAMVTDEQFVVCWTYSEQLYCRKTIERLGHEFVEALRELINHCLSTEAGGFTPSDFADVDFSQDDLDELLTEYESAQH